MYNQSLLFISIKDYFYLAIDVEVIIIGHILFKQNSVCGVRFPFKNKSISLKLIVYSWIWYCWSVYEHKLYTVRKGKFSITKVCITGNSNQIVDKLDKEILTKEGDRG